jgi:hypothetical protein
LVSCEKAKRELGFQVTPAKQAIGRTLGHLTNKGKNESLPEMTVIVGALAE